MPFLRETGFSIDPTTTIVLGLTESGQGKATGAYTLLPHLERSGPEQDSLRVQVIRPSDGNPVTQAVWKAADSTYVLFGMPGLHHRLINYDAARARGSDNAMTDFANNAVTDLANKELRGAMEGSNAHLVSMHGLFGKGLERSVVEIDTKVEPTIAGDGTHAFVPLQQTADELRLLGIEKGIQQEIEVVGFLVPDVLKEQKRAERRFEMFAQQEPSPENPFRMAFMVTGQFANLDMLRNDILLDTTAEKWLNEGRMKLDVYMWNSKRRAHALGRFARNVGFTTLVTDEYMPDAPQDIQIFYNPHTRTAVETSMQMAYQADFVASTIAERVGWTLETPFGALPVVGENRKMLGNTEWAVQHGLATPLHPGLPFSEVIPGMFGDRGRFIEEHQAHADRAKTLFTYGDLTGGAATAAQLIHERLR